MTDTLWCDISEFQSRVDDTYPYRWLSFRSNDGTYRDRHFADNYGWCVKRAVQGKLDGFIVYAVYEPDGGAWADTLIKAVGTPHPLLAVMIDVESWGGRITGDRSADINAGVSKLAAWLGDKARVTGYGNAGDLNRLWPHPNLDANHLVYANYGADPGYPGAFAHQFTDAGNVPPFGHPVDVNSADGYTSAALQTLLGLSTASGPAPASAPSPFVGAVIVNRPVEDIQKLVGVTRDGIYGPATTAAVQKWQTSHGLAADGIWGRLSDAAGFPKTVHLLIDGVYGPLTCKAEQHALHVAVDGVRGPVTIAAEQRKTGARIDGIDGPDTNRHLQTYLNTHTHAGLRVDGIRGPLTIRALQRSLDSGTF